MAMKNMILLGLLVFSTLGATAQELKWHTNLDEAITLSEKNKKPLMLFFTGSDWCGWCIRLQKEVLTTPEFTEWAAKNVILVELDFPRRTAQPDAIRTQNAQLQQFFQVRGYPTVWFAKAVKDKATNKVSFTQIGKTGYVAGGPTPWLSGANQILANNKS